MAPVTEDHVQRDRACRLAKDDPESAAHDARSIEDPWYRVQALSWAARYSESERCLALAREALASSESCQDEYQRAASTAWPLRALIEVGHGDVASEEFPKTRKRLGRVTPPSSRAEALKLIFRAAFPLGARARQELAEDLVQLAADDGHWRVQRAARDVLSMLPSEDAEAAESFALRLDGDRPGKFARAAREPEAPSGHFFW